MPKKIGLCLGGGGFLCAQQLGLLKNIDKTVREILKSKYPDFEYKGLSEYIGFIGGTSAGAINSMCIATYGDFEKVIEGPYCSNAGKFFPTYGGFLPTLLAPFTEMKHMREIMRKDTDGVKFGDIKHKLFMMSCDMSGKPTFWSNLGTEEDRRKLDYFVHDIDQHVVSEAVTSSSSAQVVFPAAEIEYDKTGDGKKKHHEKDGGNICNNPAAYLVSSMQALEKIRPKDMHIISIDVLPYETDLSHLKNAGAIQYMLNALGVVLNFFSTQSRASVALASNLVKSHGGIFHSIEMPFELRDLKRAVDHSDANFRHLLARADKFFEDNKERFYGIAAELAHTIAVQQGLEVDAPLQSTWAKYVGRSTDDVESSLSPSHSNHSDLSGASEGIRRRNTKHHSFVG